MLEILTIVGNLSLLLTVIVALIFGIAQVREAERNRRERLTIDVLHEFQTKEFIELFNYVYRDASLFPKTQEELRSMDPAERVQYFQLLQQMESLGIMVSEGLLEVDLLDKALGSFVVTAWKRFKPSVKVMRESDPFTGEYFQTLAMQMHERLSKNPRTPAHQIELDAQV